MNIETLGQGSDDVRVHLSYPRSDHNPSRVVVCLEDVRAANDIVISYDFGRDGWSIQSDLVTVEMSNQGYVEEEAPLREVAFIPAWPSQKDAPEEGTTRV